MPDQQECLDKLKVLDIPSQGTSADAEDQNLEELALSNPLAPQEEFKVYPNPVTSGQVIRWNVADVQTITVYSADWRKITEQNNENGSRQMQLDCPSGVYLLTFLRNNTIQNVQLCISGY